jgi:hypothetical protein
MDKKSNEDSVDLLPDVSEGVTPGWSKREMDILKKTEEEGAKPISSTLAAQMFSLYLEGYSCAEIAKHNKVFSEGDILSARKKFNWDNDKDRYIFDLNKQVREKLIKSKLEILEFATNAIAVAKKEYNDQAIKYLQTGKEEDKPKGWKIESPSQLKSMIEILQKVTGEDRVTKQEIRSEANVNITGNIQSSPLLQPELQTKMLRKLAESAKKGSDVE